MNANMNAQQLHAVDSVLSALDGVSAKRCFFLDGPGGTGKTYTYNTLIQLICGRGGKVITVASTGIAATLLKNGRTAHSCFKIPVSALQNSVSLMPVNSPAANELRQSNLIIWYEATMAYAYFLEVVDRLLRDITRVVLT